MTISKASPQPLTSSRLFVLSVLPILSLLAATGCDPCLNNPCNDGLACNGVETCTASGPDIVCGDGVPIECPDNTVCTEPDAICVGTECGNDEDCDDADLCTTDECITGECVNNGVSCPPGDMCDPATGECVPIETDTDTDSDGGLIDAVGTYTGADNCEDISNGGDGEVTLELIDGDLVLSGLFENDDIVLALESDNKAIAEGVNAFGNPDHMLRLVRDPETGQITLSLVSDSGSCTAELELAP